MRLRTSRRGAFFGCSNFPVCKGVRDANHNDTSSVSHQAIAQTSKQQEAIYSQIKNGRGHLLVIARAGTGKTHTAVQCTKLLDRRANVLMTAFNKHIAKELQERVGSGTTVSTLHSLGLSAINDHLSPRRVLVDEHKAENLLSGLLEDEWRDDKDLFFTILSLAKLCKGYLSDGNDTEELEVFADRHGLTLVSGDSSDNAATELRRKTINRLVPALLKASRNCTHVVDYDDMIWLPVVLDLPLRQFDFVFCDETQDLCRAQHILVIRSCLRGRIIAIGDDRQGCYLFRGASARSMEEFRDLLENTGEVVTTLPLTITRRCGKRIVELAQKIVPDFEASEKAPLGKVMTMSDDFALSVMEAGDMVVCRVNAPLVEVCYGLLRKGTKAVIRGRDIGKGLISLISRLNASDINELLLKLETFQRNELSRLTAQGKKESAKQAASDKCDTLRALCVGCQDVIELKARIEEVFAEYDNGGKPKKAVVCSSIHRGKGNESDRVFIIEPRLLLHPSAKSEDERLQELNLAYIAATRAKGCLVFVGATPELFTVPGFAEKYLAGEQEVGHSRQAGAGQIEPELFTKQRTALEAAFLGFEAGG